MVARVAKWGCWVIVIMTRESENCVRRARAPAESSASVSQLRGMMMIITLFRDPGENIPRHNTRPRTKVKLLLLLHLIILRCFYSITQSVSFGGKIYQQTTTTASRLGKNKE